MNPFDLPQDRIAIVPASKREEAKMLVYERSTRKIEHTQVFEIKKWLKPKDLLVFNSARVEPVRVLWKQKDGKNEEIVLLKPLADEVQHSLWEAIVSGKHLPLKEDFFISKGLSFQLLQRNPDGTAKVRLSKNISQMRSWLQEYGLPPLPPYIRKERKRRGEVDTHSLDLHRYQTVFAKKSGAVAAPTAGLHFTKELLEELEKAEIHTVKIHLAVGWGTFQPFSLEQWEKRKLHPEWVEISKKAAQALTQALHEGKRIIAVGTTVVRSLEWWHQKGCPEEGISGWCDLFLRPPWSPHVVNGMVTNFHLPKSSLLALVAGFLGNKGETQILDVYKEAIQKQYRFYSYGDCMLIL